MLREETRELPDAGAGAEVATAADLARGLAFLRASNMQVMRLHLAKEQGDRRGMMAALDELVGLDRALERFVGTTADPDLLDAGEAIDAQRHNLLAQRLVLGCGKLGPALAPMPEIRPDAEAAPDGPMLPEDVYTEEQGRHRWPRLLPGLLVLAAVAVGAWLALDAAALSTLISWWETLL